MSDKKPDIYNIVIVDDHPILWDSLTLLFHKEERLKVIGAAKDGAELFRMSAIKKCDILILDISMPRLDGFNVIKKIIDDYPRIKILMFTMHSNEEFFSKAIGMGAKGFVLKRDPPDTLITAVKNIIAGKLGISPSISPMLIDKEGREAEHEEFLNQLTAREVEVLSLVASGMTSRDIARTLNVKKSTIDKHRENIRNKLGTGNLMELLYHVRQKNLL